MSTPTTAQTIEFSNGLNFSLALQGDRFLGIGEVCDGSTLLRSDTLPWTVYCESESGVHFESFRLREVLRSEEEATLVFESQGQWLPRIQDADAMGDARVKSRRLSTPLATFRWHFRAIEETIFENQWRGLAMNLEVDCPGHPIHWLLEATTWELGGEAQGSTLIQQDVSAIDLEQVVEADSAFSTIESFSSEEEEGAWCGSFPMDMLPRAAGASICDFQSKENLALCLFAEKPGLTRARLEKFADENVIHYTDRAFFPLTEHASTLERKLLVYAHPQPLKAHERRNLWLDCFIEVRARIHRNYDFQLEIPQPTVTAHLWDADLKKWNEKWSTPLMEGLPRLREAGFKGVFTHAGWEGVTCDPKFEGEGNICQPYRFRFEPKFGGAPAMEYLVREAKACGLEIFQWFGFQFDQHAPVWKEHPEWLLREANGDPWDAAYGGLWCGRMRGPFGDYVFEQIKELSQSVGLQGIFWDSYQNLGVTCVDWQGKDKAPQAEEIWRFQAALQKLGYKQRCEVVTIFGVSQVGMFGFAEDKFRRRSWEDCENGDMAFALLDCGPGFFTDNPFSAEKVSPRRYFWLAAHRAIPVMEFDPWHAEGVLPGGELWEEYARVNHLYNAVLPHMIRPRMVGNGSYVLWLDEDNRPAVVWAFKDATLEYSGAATELSSGRKTQCEGTLSLAPQSVYLLQAS